MFTRHTCVNDFFGYCAEEPTLDVEGSDVIYSRGAHCKNDSETCGKYQTLTQSIRRQLDEAKDTLENWAEHDCVIELLKEVEKLEAIAAG